MPGDLIYLYAIIPDDSPAVSAVAVGDRPTLDAPAPLFSIPAGGLVAIASPLPAGLREVLESADAPPDLERIAPFAVRHEATVRSLLPLAPALIPLNFGAVYRDRESVVEFLSRQKDGLQALLARLNRKEEWTLKVYRDEARAAAAAEAASPALRDLDATIVAASAGRAHLLRKRREQIRRTEIEQAERVALSRVLAAVDSRVSEVAVDNLLNAPAIAERLVLKVACLLDRDDAIDFAEWVGDLEREWTSVGLRMELTGPWAPYSFVRSAS